MIRWVGLLVLAALAMHASHQLLLSVERPDSAPVQATYPSAAALRLMAFDYDSLVADAYWLRALGHFGDANMHEHHYPNLEPLMRRVLTLDPYFSTGYYFAGTTLTLAGQDTQASVALLRQGLQYRPDDWRIPFYLGFNLYYFLQKYAEAAEALSLAARHPQAPDYTGPLATRLAAHAGQPELGLAMLEQVLPRIRNPRLRQTYLRRRDLLRLEVQLRALRRMANDYRDRMGEPPESLKALVQADYIDAIPTDPLGGRFFIDANGRVQTTSEDERLQWQQQDAHNEVEP